MNFAGVNAHHQNGLAEHRIHELQEMARTMLIHTSKRWTNCATANIWPYAIHMANDVLNETPRLQNYLRRTPQKVFLDSTVQPNQNHWKIFGCLVYVLASNLKFRHIHHKWKERERVGIYLGISLQHSQNVALVIDRNTGLVSPQFHLRFDPSFHTFKQDKLDSKWQLRAEFVTQREPNTLPNPAEATGKKMKRAPPEELTDPTPQNFHQRKQERTFFPKPDQ